LRGLGTRARQVLKAGSAATAALTALGLFLTACATGGTGARDEGRVAAQRLVAEGRFPEAERARIVKNLTYYD